MPTREELDLMAEVARLHYLQGVNRVDIADRLDISRFKVSRLLEAAVSSGVVTITIRPTERNDPELSSALTERFSLRTAHAVPISSPEPDVLRARLGEAGANLLTEIITADDVLGLDAGRTVSHIADYLSSLPACEAVQLSGLAGAVQQTGLELLRRVTLISGGTAHPLYAPMLALDARSAATLREQPMIASTIERYAAVTVAVVSVGAWAPPESQVYDRLSEQERRQLLGAGVVAETCALMFDLNGRPVPMIDDRRVGISLEALRQVPNVIAIAGGEAKAPAILALLKSGVINTLVTDTVTAKQLLAQAAT
ncbi:MAG: DNA-binding transcriptional regulator [Propionibacteriaceae bacterium]|nr:MAG: DNA-binding transcriptional regulator [Propionibacteriaceae bacterium]